MKKLNPPLIKAELAKSNLADVAKAHNITVPQLLEFIETTDPAVFGLRNVPGTREPKILKQPRTGKLDSIQPKEIKSMLLTQSIKDIAKHFDVNPITVSRYMQRHNMGKRNKLFISVSSVLDLLMSRTLPEVAEYLNMDIKDLKTIFK